MRSMLIVAVLAAAGIGCVEPGHVVCADGRTCPTGMTCDDVRQLCVSAAQTTACAGVDDGDVCTADGVQGICDRSFCEPGCGDGSTDANEECDDGNFASHDGCSSRCLVENPTWIPMRSPWRGVSQPAVAYHPGIATGRVVMVGGTTPDGVTERIWQHDPATIDTVERGWVDMTNYFADRPSARTGAAMAYDPIRNVIVLFGGTGIGNNQFTDTVNDTWEYQPNPMFPGDEIGRWVKSSSTTAPSRRVNAAMTFDENLGKIVLVGGFDVTTLQLATGLWAYDGTWSLVTTTNPTPTRSRPSLAFDQSRDRLVMFGGGVVNEFDGAQWTTPSFTSGPSSRRGAAFAYDATRTAVVLFGGAIGTDVASDTWEWSGTAWTQTNSTRTPAARHSAQFVAVPTGLELVGGQSNQAEPFDDVWLLDAQGWDERTPRFGPGLESASQGAYSPTAAGVLVTGGVALSNEAIPETWLFDGSTWRRRADLDDRRAGNVTVYNSDSNRFITYGGTLDYSSALATMWTLPGDATGAWTLVPQPATAPPPRTEAAGAYDSVGHRTVVFSGLVDPSKAPFLTDTWFYDGSVWTVASGDHPATETGFRPAIAADPEHGVFALDSAGTTWRLDGSTWTTIIPAGADTPPGRQNAGFTYDPLRQRLVLGGGSVPNGTQNYDDVWELDAQAQTWSRVFIASVGPLPRTDMLVFTYHHNARGVLVHGGRAGGNLTQKDTWLLQYRSATVDEICDDGMDTDLDAQDDGEDPDCIPLPPRR
jgi:cysteine-rich repeat protein